MFVFQSDSLFMRQGKPEIAKAPDVGTKEWPAWAQGKIGEIEKYLQKAASVGPGQNVKKEEKDFTLFQLNNGTGAFRQNLKDIVNSIQLPLSKNSAALKYATDEGPVATNYAIEKMTAIYKSVITPDFDWNKVALDRTKWGKLDIGGCLFALGKLKPELGLDKEERRAATGKEGEAASSLQKITPTIQSPAGARLQTAKGKVDAAKVEKWVAAIKREATIRAIASANGVTDSEVYKAVAKELNSDFSPTKAELLADQNPEKHSAWLDVILGNVRRKYPNYYKEGGRFYKPD